MKRLMPEEGEIPFSMGFITHFIIVVPFALAGTWLYEDVGFNKPSVTELNVTEFLVGLICAMIHLFYYYGYVAKRTEKGTIERIDSIRYELGLFPRIFYHGVVEEVIFRWGLMSILVWFVQFFV